MTDEQIIQSGQTVANKTLETMSDIIQALIAALSDKSPAKDKEVLELFSEYVEKGGELATVVCARESYDLFDEIAKDEGLTYYAALDQTSGAVNIIVKDKDAAKLVEISKKMAERGQEIMKNPQLPVAAYTRNFGDKKIMYINIDSYEQVEKAKAKVAELGAHFAVAKKNDGSYMVLTESEDVQKLKDAEAIPKDSLAKYFAHQDNFQDVLRLIRDRRRREEEKKEMEKTQKKNRGRE